jgi:hypothetical protein
MKRSLFALTVLAAAFAAPAAHATVITFEGASNAIYTAPIARSGFSIGNIVGDEQHFHEIDSTQFGLTSNGTGVLLNDRNTSIFVQAIDDSDFTLDAVDVAASLSNNPGTAITVTGYNNGAVTGSFSFTFGSSFSTVLGSSLGSVDRLVFDGTGGAGGFELDNLTLGAAGATVPEPTSLALVLAALAGAGISRRSRKV